MCVYDSNDFGFSSLNFLNLDRYLDIKMPTYRRVSNLCGSLLHRYRITIIKRRKPFAVSL